jgi:hypothetical protein
MFLSNPFPRLDFSIHFTGETKSQGNAFQGIEKGPLPRMQQFSILATDKKFKELETFSWIKRNVSHLGAGNL